ncbi:MAG: hypothetical protein LPK02_06975 [Rhodobacterales bacterium]|nr:hypothetical protein [Rhodobacterales bacterium]
MSDETEPGGKVINLFQRVEMDSKLESDPQTEWLKLNQAELLEALDGIKGRVLSFDIRGLVIVGIAKHHSEDLTYMSSSTVMEELRVIGALEFLKTSIIYDRIQDIEEGFED